jgi:hypothetical protein
MNGVVAQTICSGAKPFSRETSSGSEPDGSLWAIFGRCWVPEAAGRPRIVELKAEIEQICLSQRDRSFGGSTIKERHGFGGYLLYPVLTVLHRYMPIKNGVQP